MNKQVVHCQLAWKQNLRLWSKYSVTVPKVATVLQQIVEADPRRAKKAPYQSTREVITLVSERLRQNTSLAPMK